MKDLIHNGYNSSVLFIGIKSYVQSIDKDCLRIVSINITKDSIVFRNGR